MSFDLGDARMTIGVHRALLFAVRTTRGHRRVRGKKRVAIVMLDGGHRPRDRVYEGLRATSADSAEGPVVLALEDEHLRRCRGDGNESSCNIFPHRYAFLFSLGSNCAYIAVLI